MSSFEASNLVTLLLIEEDCQKNLQISCSDTDVSQDIRIIRSIEDNDSLNVGWDFFLTGDFVDKKYSSLVIDVMHHIIEILYSCYVASATMGSSLRNDKPVSKVSAVSDMRIDLLQDHGQTEEEGSSQGLFGEELDRVVSSLEMVSHHLCLVLHDIFIDVVDLTKHLLEPVNDTLDLSGILLVEVVSHSSNEQVPVISAVCKLNPIVGQSEVIQDDRDLSDVALDANIDVHYSLGQLSNVSFEGHVQEEHVLQFANVVLVKVVATNIVSQSCASIHLSQGILVLVIALKV